MNPKMYQQNTAALDTPKRRTQFEDAQMQLIQSIDELANLVQQLETRLSCALRSEPPAAPMVSPDGGKVEIAHVPIAESIHSHARNVQVILFQLNSILDRLEL